MFSISVLLNKDNWDIAAVIGTVAAPIATLISISFIYWCSALNAERIRKEKEERCALDYLLVSISRYLHYMLSLRRSVTQAISSCQYNRH